MIPTKPSSKRAVQMKSTKLFFPIDAHLETSFLLVLTTSPTLFKTLSNVCPFLPFVPNSNTIATERSYNRTGKLCCWSCQYLQKTMRTFSIPNTKEAKCKPQWSKKLRKMFYFLKLLVSDLENVAPKLHKYRYIHLNPTPGSVVSVSLNKS